MHFTGTLSMATNGPPHTGGSQFFLTHAPPAHLNGKHTVFGRVMSGLDVVRSIEPDDLVETVTVLRKRDHVYEPQTLPMDATPSLSDLRLPPETSALQPTTTAPAETDSDGE